MGIELIRQKFIRREDLQKHRDWLFLFGDNLKHEGLGGQAKEMRGELNAIGIPTKKSPGTDESAYMTDLELEENKKAIDEAFAKVRDGVTVVLPEDGVGTGLAKLPEKAPETFKYLQTKMEELCDKVVKSSQIIKGEELDSFFLGFSGKDFENYELTDGKFTELKKDTNIFKKLTYIFYPGDKYKAESLTTLLWIWMGENGFRQDNPPLGPHNFAETVDKLTYAELMGFKKKIDEGYESGCTWHMSAECYVRDLGDQGKPELGKIYDLDGRKWKLTKIKKDSVELEKVVPHG